MSTVNLSKAEALSMVEAMQAQLAALTADLAAANQKLAQRPATASTGGSLGTWNGHSCTSLIRAMAQRGWTPGQIARVCFRIGMEPSPATISTQRQVAKGREAKGDKAAIAPKAGAQLSEELWAKLAEVLAQPAVKVG